MQVLFNRSSQRLAQSKTSIFVMGRLVCPCCSYILLRHLSSEDIYWHCSYCHQAMPAF
ncbi:hypothetical protein [Pleurocapsa sp. CCALA 161]|uniref:hypothetical protein n=1 Tax=Pleurocapsa sp. CCALA 161 TaxID=2107688 RepID=UPI0018EC2658|nr:hypothetical protein [Pleurocapsa sp. CCALA 161]